MIKAYYRTYKEKSDKNDIIVDVSEKMKIFITKDEESGDKIVIPKNCDLNKYFTDICFGEIKYLEIYIKDKYYLITERFNNKNIIIDVETGNIMKEYGEEEENIDNEIIEKYKGKINIVYFVYIYIRSNWWNIVEGQLKQLKKTGIVEYSNIYIHVVDLYNTDIKERIVKIIPNAKISTSFENNYEYEGLDLLWRIGQEKPNDIFLYFHSKGISYDTYRRTMHDRKLFENTISQWKKSVIIFEKEKEINKIGTLISDKGFIWKNFWYIRGSYLKNLPRPKIEKDRLQHEYWICFVINRTNKDCYSLMDDKRCKEVKWYEIDNLFHEIIVTYAIE